MARPEKNREDCRIIARLRLSIFCLLASLVLTTSAAADAGYDAYRRGDFVQAREIWRQAGYRHAQSAFNLAALFESGEGGPRSAKSAFEWYKRAADLGLMKARLEMARIFVQTRDLSLFASTSAYLGQSLRTKDPVAIYTAGMVYEVQGMESKRRGIKRWYNPLIFAWGYFTIAAQYGYADGAEAAAVVQQTLGPKYDRRLERIVDNLRPNIDGGGQQKSK